jgi:hypothetical protein
MARAIPGQSTDAENNRAAPKVVDRSAPVKASRSRLQDNKLDTDPQSSGLQADARIQKFGGSTK